MAPAQSQGSALAKDLRLDRIVTWALTSLVGLGITVAIFTYRDLKSEFKTLSNSIGALNTTVALMEQSKKQVDENKKAIHDIQIWKAQQEGKQEDGN